MITALRNLLARLGLARNGSASRVSVLIIAGLALTLLTFAACSSDNDADDGTTGDTTGDTSGGPKYGGTLRAAHISDTSTLNPQMTLSLSDQVINQTAYDNLFLRLPDLSLRPMLATSWEANADLTSYTIHLREGVKFHHGKEFKAEDVVYTFEKLLDPEVGSPGAASFGFIDEVVAIDDHTVRFDLSSPNAILPDTLSAYQAKIIPSDIEYSRLATEEFGTGPFIMEEFLPGERLTLKKNPDYWMEGRPYLDEVIVFYMGEEEARVEALKSGQVDANFVVEATSVDVLEAAAGIKLSEAGSSAYLNLAMDVRVAPFDDILVRKAIQAATDRDAILQAALFGRGTVASDHPIPPTDPVFASQYAPPAYNIELAKSLLAEANYPDGIDLTLYTSTAGEGMVEMAVAMKERAAPAGIRIEIVQTTPDAYWSEVWLVEPFTTVAWGGRPPGEAISIVYKSDAPWNESYYVNPEIDSLLEQAQGQPNLADRKATYAEIQRILIDDVPRIVVVFRPIFMAMNEDVQGLEAHPGYWTLLHETWLDR